MEVTKEFLEEHLNAMRQRKGQAQAEMAALINQYDGAIAMALMALKRLEEEEGDQDNASD